jgi:hypothetical protein
MDTGAYRTRWWDGRTNNRWIIGRERTGIRFGIRDRVVHTQNSTRHDHGGCSDEAIDGTQAQSRFKRLMESRDLVRSVFPHCVSSLPSRRDFSIERTAPPRLRTAQHRSQVALAMARSASTAPRHDVTGATFPEQKHEEPLCDSRHSRGRGTRRTRPASSQERLDRVPNERPLVLTRR